MRPRRLAAGLCALAFACAPLVEAEPPGDPVRDGLRWLARHENAEGGWRAAGFDAACPRGARCDGAGNAEFDVGVTGLALLAFHGAGYTSASRDRYVDPVTRNERGLGPTVDRGLRYLLGRQHADGGFGTDGEKPMYNHAIATLALADAYGLSGNEALREPTARAVEYLVAGQTPGAGWRYRPRCGESDASVTGWCVLALVSAELAGIPFDRKALTQARAFFERVTEPNWGKCGYQKANAAGVREVVTWVTEDWARHETLTAIGMVARIHIDRERKDPVLEQGATLLSQDLPVWDLERKVNDYSYWYWGKLALFHYDGPATGTGRHWKPWAKACNVTVTAHQESAATGCAAGSWPATDRWGADGGRVYATALCTLMLEEYYAYTPTAEGK